MLLVNSVRSSLQRSWWHGARMCTGCAIPTRHFCKEIVNPATAAKSPQKNKKEGTWITLIHQNNSKNVSTLEEAQKLVRRRNLQLLKIQDFDTKSQRPVYKITTAAAILSQDEGRTDVDNSTPNTTPPKKTVDKSLTISNKIAEHDLESRLKKITKWLTKKYEVKVLIQGESNEGQYSKDIFNKIEQSIKEPENLGKITQKQMKEQFIKFVIRPNPGGEENKNKA